jgi:amidase
MQDCDYILTKQNPCGASTGSAVGVSAGFSPISIGTEVDGSLVQPAARAGLYALKPSIGSTDLEGVYAVSEDFDSLGAMAKSTHDLVPLIEYLLNDEALAQLPANGYSTYMRKDFSGVKVGFVDPEEWRWPENVQPHHENSRQEMVGSPEPSSL